MAPNAENGTAANHPPRRRPNATVRSREHLTPAEVDKLIEAAKSNRWGQRDTLAILLAFRHGLRASELCALTWDQVDLKGQLLHVSRMKNGQPSTHPLSGTELRALRQLRRNNPHARYVIMSERNAPMSAAGFRKMLARLSDDAGLGFPVHPHMLRHACGYKLANEGRDTRSLQLYLGHKNIQHTVRYTQLDAGRFKDFWTD
ncbi:MAG: tyrosine-type recombinase/integrase [Acetobacteraceae bacterium]|nr:tyrosine-type recombinase/integrase [Acetobacteraceae bacterium]